MPKGREDREHITLACSQCRSRPDHTVKNRRNDTERLELRKYCPRCRAHHPHRETR